MTAGAWTPQGPVGAARWALRQLGSVHYGVGEDLQPQRFVEAAWRSALGLHTPFDALSCLAAHLRSGTAPTGSVVYAGVTSEWPRGNAGIAIGDGALVVVTSSGVRAVDAANDARWLMAFAGWVSPLPVERTGA